MLPKILCQYADVLLFYYSFFNENHHEMCSNKVVLVHIRYKLKNPDPRPTFL